MSVLHNHARNITLAKLRRPERLLCALHDRARSPRTIRLLARNSRNGFHLTDDLTNNIPPYAILSHTWGSDRDEVTFADVQRGQGRGKAGYAKIKFCAEQARKDKIEHFWIDTCCINKENNSELSEAITSMFRWYQDAAKCYVFLSDVSVHRADDDIRGNVVNNNDLQLEGISSLRTSRWFTRGWTLQELLAPASVEFFSREGTLLGTKTTLTQQIHEITAIPLAALSGTPPSQFSIAERLRWTEKRQTKKAEDRAYCLLGIFNVFMPLIYGEGDNAFRRLEKEINNQFGAPVTSDNRSMKAVSLGTCLASAPVINPDDFIGRTSELDAIRDLLRPNEVFTTQRRAVLGGIGGIGKTQLAVAYIRRHECSYTSILWLNAASEAVLYANLRSVARGLITAHELEKLDDQQVLTRIQEWLSGTDNTRWLLVFDNYDDPDQFNVDNFCPNIGHGSIIVTTRRPDRVTGGQIRVQPLQTIDDSLSILQTRSTREGVRTDVGAQRLAERLGGLPLALVTAGAYLRKSTITFQQYLDAYERCWQVDRRRPLRLAEYQDRTLYTTWNLTYSQIETDDGEAAQLLRLLAYFDNHEIWYELFQAELPDDSSARLPACLANEIEFASAMSTLVDYCLVELHHASHSYSMHSCVHDWTLGALNAAVDAQLYWYAFACVAANIDDSDQYALAYVQNVRIARHAVHLTHHRFSKDRDQLDFSIPKRLDQAYCIVQLLVEQMQPSAAEWLCIRLVAGCEKTLGPEDAMTAAAMYVLYSIYRNQGQLEAAEQMCLQAIAVYEKTTGLANVGARFDLGSMYEEQGKMRAAEQMYLRALAEYEKAHEPNRMSGETAGRLGQIYQSQGKIEDARQMYTRAMAGYEKALNRNDSSIFDTMFQLGSVYAFQGNFEAAEQMYLRALVGYEENVGLSHTWTMNIVHQLGAVYHLQGKVEESRQMYLRALARFEKTQWTDQIPTCHLWHDFGNLCRVHGDLEMARRVLSQAAVGFEKVLGMDSDLTISAMCNVGDVAFEASEFENAEAVYKLALDVLSDGRIVNQRLFKNALGRLTFSLYGILRMQANRGTAAQISLGRMVRHTEQWASSHGTVIYILCQALVYLKEDEHASLAWRHYLTLPVKLSSSAREYGQGVCQGCGDALTIEGGCHMCRECDDDKALCNECMVKYVVHDHSFEDCVGHDFCDVGSTAAQILSKPVSERTTTEMDMMVWLAQLREKYPVPDP